LDGREKWVLEAAGIAAAITEKINTKLKMLRATLIDSYDASKCGSVTRKV